MSKIGLVLEGGGMRGAYTTGALVWLLDNNITFNYGVGISSGAVSLCNFYLKDKELLYDISVKHTADKRNVGIIPILKERRYVGYDFMFDELLLKQIKMNTQQLTKDKVNMEIGIYDLDKGETLFFGPEYLDSELRMLKASCALPIASRVVEYNGHRYLDGGISVMIPYQRSIDKGNDKHFVIVTKPDGYIRKKAGSFMQKFMKFNYPKYPKMCEQYNNRHIAYNEQMSKVLQGVKDNNTFLVRPSKNISVKRFKGDPKSLNELFELGYSDMEAQKEKILKFINN